MSGIFTAVAIGGSAVIGGITSRNASKRAANTARETGDAQLAFMAEQEQKARGDINTLIPQATQSRLQGTQNAMDLLGQGAPMTMDAFQQGNMGAQNVMAGSMPQIQNALMGGAVNYDFMNPQKVNVDLQSLLSGVPDVYTQPQPQFQPQQQFRQADYTTPMPRQNIGNPAIWGGDMGGVNTSGGLLGGLAGFDQLNMMRSK